MVCDFANMKNIITLLTFCTLFLLHGCASKTEVNNMEERLAKLESDLNYQIEDLGAKKQETERNFRAKSAETRVTLDKLQTEIQRLTGKVEELEYKLSQFSSLADQNQKLLSGYNQPVSGDTAQANTGQQVDQNSVTGLGQPQDQQNAANDASKPAKTSPAEQPEGPDLYDSSKKMFDEGKFKESRAGFQKFIKAEPKSPKAASAQYWIADSYYKEQEYEKAALEYETIIKKYPKNNKAPAAYLKQAYAFEKVGEKATALDVLKELVKKYPDSKEAEIASKKIKSMGK